MNSKPSFGSRRWLRWLLTLSLASCAQIGFADPPFKTLHAFNGTDGTAPHGPLLQAKDSALYSTTAAGGANNTGTVFKITTNGTGFQSLYSFSGGEAYLNYANPDGAFPYAGLIQGKDGNLYGTTYYGGPNGWGTVFKITTSGTLTPLYNFEASTGDGAFPAAGLLQAKDGNLYGTTAGGGANSYGTVYQITPSGALTILHSFSTETWNGASYVNADGAQPYAGLIQGKDGNLYGTTYYGGPNGWGTVFKITTSGTLTPLYSFNGYSSDGSLPWAGVIQGKDGNLYGTTTVAGDGVGTVFQITTSGTVTYLHTFTGGADGAEIYAGLIQGKDGALYGTARYGGIYPGSQGYGYGNVFRITTSGELTVLHSFSLPDSNGVNSDGAEPFDGLLLGKDGNLYGTTAGGGAYGKGTLFKLTMIPVIKSVSPTAGPVGASVTVTGVNFTEATAVKFGTIPVPSFTINSDTSLTFAVPTPGAASARITVVNAFGSTVSGQVFKMTPFIKSFSPTSGPVGTSVTLTGANFTGATAVKIGSVAATSVTIHSDTSLTFAVPPGAVTAKITVVNSFGTGVSAKVFTVTP